MTNSVNVSIKRVQVTLGLKADGGLPTAVSDSLGHIIVGPHKFLNLLETQLGIPSTDVSFTARQIQYLNCIDQSSHKDAFYYNSYQADPFSVAKTLLQWRDQWHLAGWDGTFTENSPTRLLDMAFIEKKAASKVEPSIGQRIQYVIELLPRNPVAISSITLLDQLSEFPHLWQKLIESVDTKIINPTFLLPQAIRDSDLFKLQTGLHENLTDPIELTNDGSIVILKADTAYDSTQATSLLSRQILNNEPERTLAILAESRGNLLDEGLEATNEPRLGFSTLSPWRPILQVLPLACELLWTPLNPAVLLQFLSHSTGPIPARFRYRLAQTVSNTPGIGSEEWEKTIANCLQKEEEKEKQQHEKNIRYWLQTPKFSPNDGIDNTALIERVQRVIDWLTGALEASDNSNLKSLYYIAINQAAELLKSIERLKNHGWDKLSRDNLQRLIKDVRGTGSAVVDKHREVCNELVAAQRSEHSGAFYLPVDNVIWWDCQASDHIRKRPWSRTELTALSDAGVILQTEDELHLWLGKACLRPILNAKNKIIFVLHNDVDRHHPVWDQVETLVKKLPVLSIPSDNEVLDIPQSDIQPNNLPTLSRWWQLPENLELPIRKFESFSSLDAYINSPYKWLFQYAARIKPGAIATLNDGNLLKGSLAHRLFENYLNENENIQGINIQQIPHWVDSNLLEILQQEGSLLLQQGRQTECEEFSHTIKRSLSVLIRHLQKAEVVKVEMELWQEGLYVGGKLNGSIDLLATRKDGQEAVVDIKWGGRAFRRKSLLSGSYLQLSTYAKLRRDAGIINPPSLSYFIVVDAHMLSLNHDFFSAAENISENDQESSLQHWRRFENTWRWRKMQFDKGLIEVTVSGTEPNDASDPGETALTIPSASDTYNDYSVLTGWRDNS